MEPWNKNPKKSPWDKNQSPNVDEILNKLQQQFQRGFDQKPLGFLIIFVIIALWLVTGVFIVDPQEQAVIKRFGVVMDTVGPGPHYHLPAPIETIEKEKVTAVQRIEIGFRTVDPGPPARYRQVKQESIMLTGDENIVDVQFTVQYRISVLSEYLYNVTNPVDTVRSAAESAMREVMGHTAVGDALTIGKEQIEIKTAMLLQGILNEYQAGVKIENVKLQDVHPPESVKEAFKDVASAKEDKEKVINEAEGYANNLLPKARGEASQIINAAKAYAEEVVLLAEGKSQKFNSVYEEYKKAKDITRQRIQLDTMEQVLPRVNKIVVDPQLGKNFLPFLPINQQQSLKITEPKAEP
ncbi:MAG: FtsH protease activity modulator HflK [SAR324 cluster bacterium]|nr:FtsH protease activity modulator HflK [SAR324 cluster bacterium]